MPSHLALAGIEGDSSDARHPREIEIESWSFGCAQTRSGAGGSGIETGRPQFTEATFTCHAGSASPKLLETCATGRAIPEAVLSRGGADGQAGPVTNVRFVDVRVSSYRVTSADDASIDDQFTLRYTRVTFSVRLQQADGSLGDEITTTQPGAR